MVTKKPKSDLIQRLTVRVVMLDFVSARLVRESREEERVMPYDQPFCPPFMEGLMTINMLAISTDSYT